MNKSKKLLAVFALGALIFAVTACNNPFFPKEKEREGNSDGSGTRGTDNNLAVAIAADVDGIDVTLTAIVTGSGNGNLSYQWYSNLVESSEGGTRLSGETAETYEPPTDIPGTTYYYVEVTNKLSGQTTKAVSNTVGVVVREEGEEGYEDEPIGIIVSEPVDTPVVTIAAESDAGKVTLTAFASISDDGTLSYQWYRSAVDRSDEGAALSGATDITYTPPSSPNGTVYYYVKATNTFRGQAVSAASHTVKIVVQGGKIVIEEIVVSDTVETPSVSVTAANDGTTVTLTASASVVDGGTLSYRWYRSTADNSKSGTPIAGAAGITYEPPMGVDGTTYYYVKVTNILKGQTADAVSNTVRIVIRNGDIAIEEIIVSATVETPLVNVSAVNEGGSITITASASVSDGGTLSYRWYRNTVDNSKNGALIAGATEKTYTPPTDAVGTAYYYVKVTNALNGQTADAVSGTVKIIVQSGGITEVIISDAVKTPLVSITAVLNDRNVTITASASVGDRGTLSYQWYRSTVDNSRSGTLITGATETTYTYTPPTGAAGTTYYYVKVTNTLKGQTSVATSNIVGVVIRGDGGVIEIIDIPDVETPTASIIADVNGKNVTITLDASVSDGGTLSYQWYSNSKKSATGGTLITGTTAITYAPPTSIPGTTYYYVQVTNTLNRKTASVFSNIIGVVVPEGSGTVQIDTSDVATPLVTIAAAVTGRSVAIIAVASVTDDGTLSYQWYRNTEESNKTGTLIDGAMGITYAPPTAYPGTTYYYVIATNTLNGYTASTTSNIVGVTVPQEGAIEIIEVESEVEVPVITIAADIDGRDVTLTATASVGDGGVISYQWYSNNQRNKNGTEIAGATRVTYDAPTANAGTTYYYCLATNTLNGYTARATSNIVGVVVPSDGDIDLIEAEVPVVAAFASPSPGPYAIRTPITLTASHQPVSDNGSLSFQWYSNTANSTTGGTAIDGATGLMYIDVPTNVIKKTYYYVVATNTLYGKTASAESNVVEIDVAVTQMSSVSLSITAPVKAGQPNYLAETLNTGYQLGAVAWKNVTNNTDHVSGTFDGSTVYAATVTLTPHEGYAFASSPAFAVTINGNTGGTVITRNNNGSVTLTHTFNATMNRGVEDVTVTSLPTKMSYQHGEELNLSGLTFSVKYDDSEEEVPGVTVESLAGTTNISTNPANGQKLVRGSHNSQPITITLGGQTATTANMQGGYLTITPKPLTVTEVSHSKVYDGNTTASNITPVSWTGMEFNETVTVATVVGTYTVANAGTRTMSITGGNLAGGGDSSNYTVGTSNNVTVIGDGITKATPTVTWPTGLSGTYGNALSSISLASTNGSAKGVVNNDTVNGTWTWTPANTLVGNVGSQTHTMTFTPANSGTSANYTSTSGTANITVNARPVTITAGTVSRTLTPFDVGTFNGTDHNTSGTFTVTLGNMANNTDTVTVALQTNTYGLSVSNNTGITSAGKTLTLTYNTTSAVGVTNPSLALSISGNSNYTTNTTPSSPTVTPTVIDGQDAARPIPVTKENFSRFNTYANTTAGLTRHYKLMEDITLTAPATGSNWTPIGNGTTNSNTYFTGSFDGNFKTISNLTVRNGGSSNHYFGMFGHVSRYSSGVVIKNLGLVNVTMSTTYNYVSYVGGLAGRLSGGAQIEKCFVTGSVAGYCNVGGIVGYANYSETNTSRSSISNCYSTASVTGSNSSASTSYAYSYVGGVAGWSGLVSNCYATGAVSNTTAASGTSNFVAGVVARVGSYEGNTNAVFATVRRNVALNSSITTNSTAATRIGRVYLPTTATSNQNYNYGKTGITMTYNNGETYVPTSTITTKDGLDTSTWNTQAFWTSATNFGTAAAAFDLTTIWEWSTSLTRPVLRGFATQP